MLNRAAVDDILKSGIPSVTDGYDDGFGLGSYLPEVVSKGKHRPVVADGAEVSVSAIVKNTVRDERGADGDVTPSPVSRIDILSAL